MTAPGGLVELGERVSTWDAKVGEVAGRLNLSPALSAADRDNAKELRVPDWPAVPARIRACLGRARADRLLDARNASGDTGRSLFQEEYAEWRVVRDADGPVRFELTTELADYWELLARYDPARLVELVGDFADDSSVTPIEVFGGHDPFADTSTKDDRAEAFSRAFVGRNLEGKSIGRPREFNNGERAITCLSRDDNTLGALINLVAASAKPILIVDSKSDEPRFPSGSEAIPQLRAGAAQDCRASDPLVVERIVRVATEGRLVRFDDPIGIYIVAVQRHDLLDPDGQPVPEDWLQLTRHGPSLGDSLARHQRLKLEAPRDARFKLSDLRSRRTGERIAMGAQIAELIELGVYVRVSEPDRLPIDAPPRPQPRLTPCARRDECAQVEADAARLEGT